MKKATTVRFHVGRGGHYHNSGHMSYEGECTAEELINLCSNDLFYNPTNHYEVMQQIAGRSNIEKLYYACYNAQKFENFTMKTGIEVSEEWGYFDLNGRLLATDTEVDSGEICLEWDYDYDTDIICAVNDLSDESMQLIIDRGDSEILKEIAEHKGFSEIAIELMDYFNNWDDLINITNPEKYEDRHYLASDTESEDSIIINGIFYSEN